MKNKLRNSKVPVNIMAGRHRCGEVSRAEVSCDVFI